MAIISCSPNSEPMKNVLAMPDIQNRFEAAAELEISQINGECGTIHCTSPINLIDSGLSGLGEN
jgi:hypothetical protein